MAHMKDMQVEMERCCESLTKLRHQIIMIKLCEFVKIKNYRKRMKFIKKVF